ncbi:hypothetical protein CDAR_385551 [Caerostris darwini]|uniref:Uncharacterized protein n=1 Tax=Caerostris darwini TaxID=1538125 RepID=A0AAV4M4Z8_9ARAC|nr:hypothetical protein CDAR_385551 [Caerostris darwini]
MKKFVDEKVVRCITGNNFQNVGPVLNKNFSISVISDNLSVCEVDQRDDHISRKPLGFKNSSTRSLRSSFKCERLIICENDFWPNLREPLNNVTFNRITWQDGLCNLLLQFVPLYLAHCRLLSLQFDIGKAAYAICHYMSYCILSIVVLPHYILPIVIWHHCIAHCHLVPLHFALGKMAYAICHCNLPYCIWSIAVLPHFNLQERQFARLTSLLDNK